MKRLLAGIMVVAAVQFAPVEAGNRKPLTSADVVKINATATKPDGKGMQKVTLTLTIDKGWHLIANPPNNELIEADQVTVTIAAKEKMQFDVKFPTGKTVKVAKEKWDIYEGVVKIEANVIRTKSDSSPLEISVYVRVFDDKSCLVPVTMKLIVN